jgi:hypothetical protein
MKRKERGKVVEKRPYKQILPKNKLARSRVCRWAAFLKIRFKFLLSFLESTYKGLPLKKIL